MGGFAVDTIDLTFDCPTISVPADALPWREPTTLGTETWMEAVRARAEGWFDPTCPETADGDSYLDACQTEDGSTLAVAYTVNDGGTTESIDLVPSSGALTRLSVTTTAFDGEVIPDEIHALSGSARWEGDLDGRIDGDVEMLSRWSAGPYTDDYVWAETWDDGVCSWSTSKSAADPAEPPYHWEIVVGPHTLTVDDDPACYDGVRAVLDGAVYIVDAETWVVTPLEGDTDGDGVTEASGDCGPEDPDVHPCAEESLCSPTDVNCNGVYENDPDRDGHASICSGGDDCDDEDASIHPGAADDPCDYEDSDCTGDDARPVDGCDPILPAQCVSGEPIVPETNPVACDAPACSCTTAPAPFTLGAIAAALWTRRRRCRATR